MLAVNAKGDVFPADAMAERYIGTRSNYRQEDNNLNLADPQIADNLFEVNMELSI